MEKIDYKTYKKPTDFISFEQGDNRIRILSNGGMYLRHSMKTARGFIPLGECQGEGCEHCNNPKLKDPTPKKVWVWIALNRDTGVVGVLETGVTIGDAICEMAKELSQDPQEYDIIINRQGSKLSTKYKVTKAAESEDLTEKEEKRVKANRQYLISKHFNSDRSKA